MRRHMKNLRTRCGTYLHHFPPKDAGHGGKEGGGAWSILSTNRVMHLDSAG